jgi:glycine cleavage system pyridoxal-binding protein P
MLHNSQKDFLKRHIGPSEEDQNKMLKELNYNSLDDLITDLCCFIAYFTSISSISQLKI